MNTDTTQISAAIVDALADGEVHRWSELRRSLPGPDDWQRGRALVALVHAGRVDAGQVGGSTYVSLPLDLPATTAA